MSETINYTRLTTSDRFSDRFLTCQAYQPVDPEQAQAGLIFSQIEIGNPWFPTSQIGQTVINTLIREYYRGGDTSDLVNFENAVKKVNEALAQIAQNGETDWIGKFNGVLALIVDKEVHFAQTGMSEAYLYRANKVSQITEGLNNDEPPHPLKTFSNLTSGTIQEGDKIVIGNSSFFDVISAPELKTLAMSFRPTLTAVECAKILRARNVQTANAIFIELTTKEELANVPPDQKVDAIYIDQPMYNFGVSLRSFFSRVISPAAKTIGEGLATGGKKTANFIAPRLKKGLEKTKAHTAKAAQAIATARQNTKEKMTDESQQDSSVRGGIKKFSLKLKNRFRRILIRFGLYSSKKSRMYLIPLIAVVLILAITVGYSLYARGKRQNNKLLETAYAQLTTLDSQAKLAREKKDDDGALENYKNLIASVEKLKGSKYESQANSLKENAVAKIREISKISIISSKQTVDIKQETDGIVFANNAIFAFAKSGEVFELKAGLPASSPFAKVTGLSGQIQSICSISEDKKIAFILANKKLGIFDITGKKYTEQKAALEYAGAIKSYGGNIYELVPPANQIIKITGGDGVFEEITQYIKDENADVVSGVDLAIDGSIYVLSADGKITRFSRGNINLEIKIELLAKETLANYKNIFASEESSSIFAVSFDKNNVRIIELRKSGDFVAQFELDGTQNSKQVATDLNDRVIYILKDNKVLTYKI